MNSNLVTVRTNTASKTDERLRLEAKAKSLNIPNSHLMKDDTLVSRISAIENQEKLNIVPPINFAQVHDFLSQGESQHLVDCFSALDRLVLGKQNFGKFFTWFDDNFVSLKGTMESGLDVEWLYSHYLVVHNTKNIKLETFASLLEDAFSLFRNRGWSIDPVNSKIIIGARPSFTLTFHVEHWLALDREVSKSQLFNVFNILLSTPKSMSMEISHGE